MTPGSISIVLPAYNEAESLAAIVERTLAVMPELGSEFEVILVDDGSVDGTRDVAFELMRAHPEVRVAAHPSNRGYGAALRTGFGLSRFDLVFYTDADNQFDPGDLKHFLPLMGDYDAIVGFRVYRYDTVLRSMLSWIYNRLVNLLFRVRLRDVDCSFKLFRREVIEQISIECDDFFVDTELVAKARKWNFRILEKGVRHYPRMAGETTVRPSDIPATLRQVALMWRRIYFPGRRHLERMAERRRAERPADLEITREALAADRPPGS